MDMDIPATAVDLVTILAGLIAGWIGSGYIGSYLTDVLKGITWLSDEDRSAIAGRWAELTAIVLSVGLNFGVNEWLLPLAQYLDTAGHWTALLLALPAIKFAKDRYLGERRS